MAPVNCCHALLQPLAKSVSSNATGSVWATDVPGWITAAGTALLAIFAILTTIYAVRAFRKQSQEVSDQASMLEIQSEQLAEQRKVNERQTEVLELQAAELRESLEERKRAAVERRKAQASRVFISQKAFVETAHMRVHVVDGELEELPKQPQNVIALISVVNSSDQPVYDASLWWHRSSEGYGDPNPEVLGTLMPGTEMQRDREFPPGTGITTVGAIFTFRDAAGVNWIRMADGFLVPAESHLALEMAKLLPGPARKDAPSPHIAPDIG